MSISPLTHMPMKYPNFVRSEPGEVLSSWLVRSALHYGMDPLSLTSLIWPEWRALLCDIDRGLSPEATSLLERFTGAEPAHINSLMLSGSYSALFIDGLSASSMLPWVVSRGSRGRVCLMGMPYCPQCLVEDSVPYFRQAWRMAFTIACIRHRCQLRSSCWHCGCAVQYSLLSAENVHLDCCWRCGANLSEASWEPCNPVALAFQQVAVNVLFRNAGYYGDHLLSATQWFTVNRYMVSLVKAAGWRRCSSLRRALLTLPGCSGMTLPVTSCLPFESCTPRVRADLLAAARTFFMAGPQRLSNAMCSLGVTQSLLNETGIHMPDVLLPYFSCLKAGNYPASTIRQSHCGPSSPQSVDRCWERIRRKLGAG